MGTELILINIRSAYVVGTRNKSPNLKYNKFLQPVVLPSGVLENISGLTRYIFLIKSFDFVVKSSYIFHCPKVGLPLKCTHREQPN